MRPVKDLPTSIFLEYFYVDIKGILRWKRKSSNKSHACPGDVAGGVSPSGYYIFKFEGVRYSLHRILYKVHNNIEIFESIVYIDHINGDKLDNSKNNLRSCTQQQNSCNARISKSNTTGVKGLSIHKTGKNTYYRTYICSNSTQYRQLFQFNSNGFADACKWLDVKRVELHREYARK